MMDRIRNVPQPTSKIAKINVISPRSIIETVILFSEFPLKPHSSWKYYLSLRSLKNNGGWVGRASLKTSLASFFKWCPVYQMSMDLFWEFSYFYRMNNKFRNPGMQTDHVKGRFKNICDFKAKYSEILTECSNWWLPGGGGGHTKLKYFEYFDFVSRGTWCFNVHGHFFFLWDDFSMYLCYHISSLLNHNTTSVFATV